MSLEGVAETSEESRTSAAVTASGGGGVLARRRLRVRSGPVACSSSANVPYCSLLHLPLPGVLTLEFFIEREDCTLGAVVDVSCSSSAGAELG